MRKKALFFFCSGGLHFYAIHKWKYKLMFTLKVKFSPKYSSIKARLYKVGTISVDTNLPLGKLWNKDSGVDDTTLYH